MILYIGFSLTSHKLHAHILCRTYKHCAPVIVIHNKAIIYQFINPKNIVPIQIRKQDLERLKSFGWIFIKYKSNIIQKDILKIHAMTCVQFTKQVCHIKNIYIQTPDALLRYLK